MTDPRARTLPMTYAFISTMRMVPWGGSEVLWSQAAAELLRRGATVQTRTTRWPAIPPPLAALATAGAKLTFDNSPASLVDRVRNKISPGTAALRRTRRVRDWLATLHAPRVIISCGSLLDDFSALADLADDATPYIVIVQAAGPEIWPSDSALPLVTKLLLNARRVLFVSAHNRDDVQCCLGRVLENAHVLPNPPALPDSLLNTDAFPAFPLTDGLRLACVARLDVSAKGQDVLLRVLARPRWRERDVAITFYGLGPQREALGNAARYLGLRNVTFAGQVSDIGQLWSRHNLGVLPSRYEGLPLALVEAMFLGRANIVPGTCGSLELVDDNITGFVAAAPTPDAFAEALERAWQRRHELAALGQEAARRIRVRYAVRPGHELANRLPAYFGDESS